MSVAPVILDDLTWTDLTNAARDQLPALSSGLWTLHAPVDPGITLIELYAWLLEQRLYWMSGTPDTLTAAVLALLGLRPRGAAVASTVFHFPSDKPGLVPARTLMRPRDASASIWFSTDQPALVLPLAVTPGGGSRPLVGLRGADAELGTELMAGRVVQLFDHTAEMTITLRLSASIPANATGEVTLLLLLDQSGVPEWSADAVAGITPPATLSWWYSGAGGTRTALPNVIDGTLGLRRSGIVRFPPPADWQSAPVGTDGVTYSLVMRADNAAFAAPPRLSGIWPNVSTARHRRVVRACRTVEWLKLPGNTIALEADETPPIVGDTRVVIREADGRLHRWYPTDDLGRHGRRDRVFALDRTSGVLRFGDGQNGRIPCPDAQGQLRLIVAVGGGVAGNIGAGASWDPVDNDAIPGASNVVSAAGGAEPETMDAACERANGSLRAIERAILPTDYEFLACHTPGVAIARAHAAPGYLAAFPCTTVPGVVTVFIVPWVARDPDLPGPQAGLVPDPGALDAVAAHLDAARLLGAEVIVASPLYVPVTLAVDVLTDGGGDGARQAITTKLATFLDPLVGDDGSGWPFGEKLRPSALLHQAQDAIGELGEVTRLAITLPDAIPPVAGQDCEDVPIGAHALPALLNVDVRVAGSLAASGGLT